MTTVDFITGSQEHSAEYRTCSIFRRSLLEPHHLYAVHHGHSGCTNAAAVCQSSGGLNSPLGAQLPQVLALSPAAATGCLVQELKAKGQEKGEDAFDERLPVTKE